MKIEDIDKIEKINSKIILIKIIDTKGSVPRNKNVSMVINNQNQYGTIGGGELEYRATKEALKLLNNNVIEKNIEYPLGPSLGQCCGGYIKIQLKKYENGIDIIGKNNLKNEIMIKNKNLYIFGAGHVSSALMNKLEGTGFNVFVVDSRENYLSKINNKSINKIFAKNSEIIINNAPIKSYYLIMTHSHQIDLSICSLLLKKKDYQFIGLIGSKTKKARFSKKLKELGHKEDQINNIECPIGIDEISGKEPDVIAISIIARLLQFKSLIESNKKSYIKLIKG